MLLHLLIKGIATASMESDNAGPRAYANQLIDHFTNNPGQCAEFVSAFTNIRATCPKKEILDWSVRLKHIPETFTIVNTYTCRYRQIINDGVLMVVECNMVEQDVVAGNYDRLYVFPFYAYRNAGTGDFEISTLPLELPMYLKISRMYGERFFWALKQLPPHKPIHADQHEEKKLWWRRITGT